MIEINAPLANCGSQSEFVEKAVRFYDGYLKVQNAGAFLPHAVADVLKGTLGVSANRMAKLLFNLTVEHNITNHLLAADRGYDTRGIQQAARRQRPRCHQHTGCAKNLTWHLTPPLRCKVRQSMLQ